MVNSSLVTLKAKTSVLTDAVSYILSQSSGKTVLDVGAAGNAEDYLPTKKHQWLHYRLSEVAKELIGLDIDQKSIDYAGKYGIHIIQGDCETIQLGRRFEIIIMSEVIEHLNAPAIAIQTLIRHLEPKGKILITTPNPTHYGLIARSCLGYNLRIYYDHICCFLPEHFQVICNRFGYHLSEIYFFSNVDNRTLSTYAKSSFNRFIGYIHPRWCSSLMVVIEPRER